MRLPRRKSANERLKLALVKRIERDMAPHWGKGLLELRVESISSTFTNRGMEVHVQLSNEAGR